MSGSGAEDASDDYITVEVSEIDSRRGGRHRRGRLPSGATTNLEETDDIRIVESRTLKMRPDSTIHDVAQTFYDAERPLVVVHSEATGEVLMSEATLEEVGIEDGSKLVIVQARKGRLLHTLELLMGRMDRLMWAHYILWGLLITVLIACLAFVGYKTNLVRNAPPVAFSLVIDAGSVHSSAALYSWQINKTREMDEVYSCEFEEMRGISSFLNEPEEVRDYITGSRCLQRAISYVPWSARNVTNVYLGGTGGMRSVMYTHPVQARQILGNVTVALEATGFRVGAAEVIDGVDEAVYGWITVNGDALTGNGSVPEVGSLDWGGASSQITFPMCHAHAHAEVHADAENDEEEPSVDDSPSVAGNRTTEEPSTDGFQSVSVYNKSHDIYSVSHMCYGQEEALKRYLVSLIYEEYSKHRYLSRRFYSPCQPKGYVPMKATVRDLYTKCTQLKDDDFNVLMSKNLPQVLTFVGTGNQSLCQAMIDEQFDPETCAQTYLNDKTTCFDARKVAKPSDNPDLKFRAFSTYWYLVEIFKIPASEAETLDSLSISLERFDNITEEICASRKLTLLASWGSPDRVHNSCFRAMFMRKLLVDGYGLDSDWKEKIEFVSRVGGVSVGWTKGYMIYHVGLDAVTYTRDKTEFWTMAVCFLAIFFIGFTFIVEFPRCVGICTGLVGVCKVKLCPTSPAAAAAATSPEDQTSLITSAANEEEIEVVEDEHDSQLEVNSSDPPPYPVE